MAIGWMVGIVETKSKKTITNSLSDTDPIYQHGKMLTLAIPVNHVYKNCLDINNKELLTFQAEVADYTETFLTQIDGDELTTAISMYKNPQFESVVQEWLQEGEDIGVAQFKHMSTQDLHTYLGLQDGLPLAFRQHTHNNYRCISLDSDEAFEGSTPVSISWHQLVFVATFFSQMHNVKRATLKNIHHSPDADKALIGIREKWGEIPTKQYVPWHVSPCYSKFSKCKKLSRLEMETREPMELIKTSCRLASGTVHFFCPKAIHLVIISTSKKRWASDMSNIHHLPAGMKPIQQIILIPSMVLMWIFTSNKQRIVHHMEQGLPHLQYQLPTNTVFSMCFRISFGDKDVMNLALLFHPALLNYPTQEGLTCCEKSSDDQDSSRCIRAGTAGEDNPPDRRQWSSDFYGMYNGSSHQMPPSSSCHMALQQLPAATIVHISVDVTDNESQESYKEIGKEAFKACYFDVGTLGVFFNQGHQKLSFPHKSLWTLEQYGIEQLESDTATKLKCLIKLCHWILLEGTEQVIPSEYIGTVDRITQTSDFGLPDLLQNCKVQQITWDQPHANPQEKILIYTMFQKFHLYIQKACLLHLNNTFTDNSNRFLKRRGSEPRQLVL
ncbi:hypothetical protein GYMLUDRAFT_63769 [Collybiopsis luxurians FD-317 M1]|uniref:Uncharacterized protein n=1 Tax=Collybiopsis luxurians FD-317 M1 TaxID=944289 RepID=A0A0D0BF04_9AGAR|nr:hypothetical protein GYMLUDRAFT_63769 [Collybiopsis luxurians FD-317 M1]